MFYYPKGKTCYCALETCGGKESAGFQCAAADEEFYGNQY